MPFVEPNWFPEQRCSLPVAQETQLYINTVTVKEIDGKVLWATADSWNVGRLILLQNKGVLVWGFFNHVLWYQHPSKIFSVGVQELLREYVCDGDVKMWCCVLLRLRLQWKCKGTLNESVYQHTASVLTSVELSKYLVIESPVPWTRTAMTFAVVAEMKGPSSW